MERGELTAAEANNFSNQQRNIDSDWFQLKGANGEMQWAGTVFLYDGYS